MKEKIYGAKNILLIFAIVITFPLTISCSKPVNYYINQVDNFLDKGYPKPERILGTLVSEIDHDIVDVDIGFCRLFDLYLGLTNDGLE